MARYRIVPKGTNRFEVQAQATAFGSNVWRPVSYGDFYDIERARAAVKKLIEDEKKAVEHAKTPIEYYEG